MLCACLAAGSAWGQLRVATWNVTYYSGGRSNEFRTAIYGAFQGRRLAPDVLIGQEFLSAAAVDEFLLILNFAPGSPGDWAAAPFVNGPDSDSALFYRTSKVRLVGTRVVAFGSTAPGNQPRNTMRYDIQPRLLDGYAPSRERRDPWFDSTIALYSSHMKAGSTTDDQQRRLVEAERIRSDAAALPSTWHFLVAGDFNIQRSTQAAYQELVGPKSPDLGRFLDPINTPGNWNNNSAFRFVHTQDPAGQMDDRLDFILLSGNLVDGDSMDYLGDPSQPYSTSTWDDPNHSYRAWGNDGSSYNQPISVSTNTMVGADIAQALRDSSLNGGHLPVVLDLLVFPSISRLEAVRFGAASLGTPAARRVEIGNTGNVKRWGALGIAALGYTVMVRGDFSTQQGPFTDFAGGFLNQHIVQMDTSTPGEKVGELIVESNDPLAPVQRVRLSGFVH